MRFAILNRLRLIIFDEFFWGGMLRCNIEIRTVTDQVAALKDDVASIQEYPLLPKDSEVAGVIFDVKSGRLTKII